MTTAELFDHLTADRVRDLLPGLLGSIGATLERYDGRRGVALVKDVEGRNHLIFPYRGVSKRELERIVLDDPDMAKAGR